MTPTVSFVLYDENVKTISEVSNTEMTALILGKMVTNAKLENTVVKMTDGNLSTINSDNESRIFYVLDCTEDVFSFVDGSGLIWKMSLNVARDFFGHGGKKITNAKITAKGLAVNKHPNFTTTLRRSTEHYHHP